MSTTTSRKQHINVRSNQLEMESNEVSSNPLTEDFTSKLQDAQHQIELLRKQQAEVERRKIELQELNESKDDFLHGQVEVQEKLTTAITAMDREIFATRQETEELEQARVCFADHLEKINQLNPEDWNNENLKQELARAISTIDLAEDEYEQAVDHFSGGRAASVFGMQSPKAKRSSSKSAISSDFALNVRNGLAFNLPIIVFGAIALIAYLLK